MPRPIRRLAPLLRHQALHLATLALLMGTAIPAVTRIVLLTTPPVTDLSPSMLLDTFARGLVGDLAFGAMLAGLVAALGTLLHRGARATRTRTVLSGAVVALLLFALTFLAVAETLFWDEFTTRFNFIAVDYLIYTTEVVGNIRESYPVTTILSVLGALSIAGAVGVVRAWPARRGASWRLPTRALASAAAVALMLAAARVGLWNNEALASDAALRADVTHQELARSGPYGFIAALRDNSLSFERFYATVDHDALAQLTQPWPRVRHATPAAAAAAAIATAVANAAAAAAAVAPSAPAATQGVVRVSATVPQRTGRPAAPDARPAQAPAGAQGARTRPRHVVVIQVESLSAEFLGAFGNDRGLTPSIDRLAAEGVLFTQMYAIGTRTVRGLEALSAALPPLPGQSVLRRPGNEQLTTLGAVLRDQGFQTAFLYGGYGYFDNMNGFFADNGYQVEDRRDLPADRVGFANVWGVSDEYLFDHAIRRIDAIAATGQRGFLHLMTTSNHRPYTYPDGRIDIPSKTGRDGAVKYTDWAIGRFIEQARARPWFDDTLFVIVADHCASVAGRTSLPPDRYHIPAILYAPRHLAARRVDVLSSQIDLAPTLVAWLGFDDHGRFFGQDLFGDAPEPRAFLGNYQEVGLLTQAEDGSRDLVVLAPRRRVSQYRVAPDASIHAVPVRPQLARRAIAEFQQASETFTSGQYRHVPERLAVARPRGVGGS
ncbi:MAG TPA: LTA synthase family protein [Quisquiliibacterium sp.]|nr:LTA synthase family protein [Quisquiliibacterium sp.]